MTLHPTTVYHHTKFGDTTGWVVQKISSGQTIEILNSHHELDIEHVNPVFSMDTLAYDALPAHYISFQKND